MVKLCCLYIYNYIATKIYVYIYFKRHQLYTVSIKKEVCIFVKHIQIHFMSAYSASNVYVQRLVYKNLDEMKEFYFICYIWKTQHNRNLKELKTHIKTNYYLIGIHFTMLQKLNLITPEYQEWQLPLLNKIGTILDLKKSFVKI